MAPDGRVHPPKPAKASLAQWVDESLAPEGPAAELQLAGETDDVGYFMIFLAEKTSKK